MIRSMYLMVSIPACSLETIYEPPVILGVFESRELAKEAWKARPKEYRDIKAKTVHTYVETMETEEESLPKKIWLWALYRAKQLWDGHVSVSCYPYNNGFLPSYECFERGYAELMKMKPLPYREYCRTSGIKLFAENPHIIAEFEPNKLSRYTVPLTFIQHFESEDAL